MLGVSDMELSIAFYDTALAPLRSMDDIMALIDARNGPPRKARPLQAPPPEAADFKVSHYPIIPSRKQ